MATYDGGFNGRPGYVLRLVVNLASQNQAANTSVVNWALYIVDTQSYGSYDFGSYGWSASIDGQGWNGATGYDFRGYNTLLLGSGSKTVAHNADGYKDIANVASFNGGSTIGAASTSGWLSLPRIPKPPGAPLISGTVGGTPLGVDQVTATSARVRFSGTTDGGSAITGWEIQYATDAAFTQNVKTWNSSGTSTITGLLPGTRYYFRARGFNGVGAGAYSATVSATTLTSLYVSDGTDWGTAQVLVSDGTSWVSVPLQYSDGTAWLVPLT